MLGRWDRNVDIVEAPSTSVLKPVRNDWFWTASDTTKKPSRSTTVPKQGHVLNGFFHSSKKSFLSALPASSSVEKTRTTARLLAAHTCAWVWSMTRRITSRMEWLWRLYHRTDVAQ